MTTPTPSIRPVLDSALDAIGNTPLIRLDRIAGQEGLKCNLLAKLEFLNVGGSVKDRIAKRMIEKAEEEGRLIPGESVVIEPTSGNTGIGLALACAIKSYPVIITLPEKMSLEKEITLRAFGAEIVRTPTEVPSASEYSNIGVAKRLQKLIPGGVILDQYNNPANPDAHEFGTGHEIIEAIANTPSTSSHPSSGRVDVFFAGAGTGGTITGTSKAIKRHHPNAIVVGIDPKGSILARPEGLNKLEGANASYAVEGIGYDFVPGVLSHDQVDQWVKTDDNEAWAAARRLMRTEGLLVGGSSGSIFAGALRWLKTEEGMASIGGVEGKNVVIILPDSIRNYMSKPWFGELTKGGEESKLAKQISEALQKS